MLDIESFSKALKTTWVKKRLDQNNHGKWKIFFEVELQNLCGTSFFYCNLERKDLQGYVQSEDAFLLEVVQIWAEINFENKIGSYNQFLSTNLWHNPLIRVEGRPIFFKEWSTKGIHKVSHLMKDSNSFLSYAEFKECHNQGRIQKIQKEGAEETDDAVLHHSGSICDQTLGLTLRTFQKYRKKRGGGSRPPWPPLNPPMTM